MYETANTPRQANGQLMKLDFDELKGQLQISKNSFFEASESAISALQTVTSGGFL
jgi:hypothetical protein